MMNTKSFLVDLKIFFQIVTYRSNLEVGKLQKKICTLWKYKFLNSSASMQRKKRGCNFGVGFNPSTTYLSL